MPLENGVHPVHLPLRLAHALLLTHGLAMCWNDRLVRRNERRERRSKRGLRIEAADARPWRAELQCSSDGCVHEHSHVRSILGRQCFQLQCGNGSNDVGQCPAPERQRITGETRQVDAEAEEAQEDERPPKQ